MNTNKGKIKFVVKEPWIPAYAGMTAQIKGFYIRANSCSFVVKSIS